ncbi:MAG: glutamate formimidoyltransferase [Elusimicrobia bacterium]|nr:glutamate formimidoyltransferase [Elusimicrobiota bacterium]
MEESQWVECVPNFSEGRDPAKVEAIVSAIRSIEAIRILDIEKDPDHHRSVITFLGRPEKVLEAAFRGVQKAAELIDLNSHRGAHPRIGAADVIPFIPILSTPMSECVHLAHRLGKRIAQELKIPVYFYGEAALRPERRELPAIRKGEFEKLKEEIKTDPQRQPDDGPPQLHPTAGATAVGARNQILNFNVNLKTSDLEIARSIARKIRTSGGGLPHLRAKEIPRQNPSSGTSPQVQVSTVLTCPEETPLHAVLKAIEREAAEQGVELEDCEIVGLVPVQALLDFSRSALKLKNFNPQTQILENHLPIGSEDIPWWEALDRLTQEIAAPRATPGGGSVSAIAGALACALGRMALGLAASAPSAPTQKIGNPLEELKNLGQQLRAKAREDSQAFESVLTAFKIPKSDAERPESIRLALRRATEIPLQTAQLSLRTLEVLTAAQPLIPQSSVSDLEVARHLAKAAVSGGLENVQINIQSMKDAAYAQKMRQEIERLAQGLSGFQ